MRTIKTNSDMAVQRYPFAGPSTNWDANTCSSASKLKRDKLVLLSKCIHNRRKVKHTTTEPDDIFGEDVAVKTCNSKMHYNAPETDPT